MKIYNRVIIDMETGEVIEEDSFQYDGPVAECKGGSTSTTDTYDKKYNKRMAKIAERQQAMAEEYFDFWKDYYQPMEQAQIAANMEMIPLQTEAEKLRLGLEREQIQSARGLLPLQTEYETERLTSGIQETQAARPLMAEFYKQALTGVNVGERVQQARSDVAQAYSESGDALRRDAARMGLDPNSARFANLSQTRGLDFARSTAGAMTGARTAAEDENFKRLAAGTSVYKGGLPK